MNHITANADQPFSAARGASRLRTPDEIAAAQPNPQNIPDDLRAALTSLDSTIVGCSRDWGVDYRDAWIYGVVVGWGCDEQHEHDPEICTDATAEIAARHGWSGEQVARMQRYHRAVLAALGELAEEVQR